MSPVKKKNDLIWRLEKECGINDKVYLAIQ